MLSTLTIGQQKRAEGFALSGRTNPLKRFLTWADNQNEDRFIWLAIALMSHASVLTPITSMTVMATTNNFSLVMVALSAMALALVTNLAALPTKITIPAFVLSIIIDVVVVITTFVIA